MNRIGLRDVTPRDGLQDHPTFLATDVKLELVTRLLGAGVRCIEVTSFVSPKRVPQLADAPELCAALQSLRTDGVVFSAFAATCSGAERALGAGVDEISTAVPATDGMSRANFNRSTDEMLKEAAAIRVLAPDVPMSATVAVAFGCPYDGRVTPETAVGIASRLVELGYETVLFGDTVGVGVPTAVRAVIEAAVAAYPDVVWGAHFHDARGVGLANVVAAVETGAALVDGAVAGMGGCPFAPGAAGNVGLEDVAWMLSSMGYDIDIDPLALADVARWVGEELGVTLNSRMPLITPFRWET